MNKLVSNLLKMSGCFGGGLVLLFSAAATQPTLTEETMLATVRSGGAPHWVRAHSPYSAVLFLLSLGCNGAGIYFLVRVLFPKLEQHKALPSAFSQYCAPGGYVSPRTQTLQHFPTQQSISSILQYQSDKDPAITPSIAQHRGATIPPQVQPLPPLNVRSAMVLEQITQYQGGWVRQMLMCQLLIWGSQGAYKSHLAAFIALLRLILKGHTIEICDPHDKLNSTVWYPLKLCGADSYGAGKDYGAITRRIQQFYKRLEDAVPDKAPHTVIFDEVSHYAREIRPAAIAENLLPTCLTDTRKGKEYPILLAHNNTQSFVGGATGTHQAMQEGLVEVHLFSERDADGEFYPLYKGEVLGLKKNNRGQSVALPIAIEPQWMNAEWLLSIFPEYANGFNQDSTVPSDPRQPLPGNEYRLPTPPPSAPPTGRSQNSQSTPPPESPEKPEIDSREIDPEDLAMLDELRSYAEATRNSLPPHLRAILEFARKQGKPLTARDVQRASLKALEGFSAEAIRLCFESLASQGYGEVSGEGTSLNFAVG